MLARHLILKNTYALSGTDISAFSIVGQSGLNLPFWTFMTQSACTVDHSAPGPFPLRNALGRMMCWTTRAGGVDTCLHDLCVRRISIRVPGR
jgi:hypothetical protein